MTDFKTTQRRLTNGGNYNSVKSHFANEILTIEAGSAMVFCELISKYKGEKNQFFRSAEYDTKVNRKGVSLSNPYNFKYSQLSWASDQVMKIVNPTNERQWYQVAESSLDKASTEKLKYIREYFKALSQ